MRWYLFSATLTIMCAALSACGGGTNGPGTALHGATHNVRTFASMSMPAFLPDGSKFVANGTKLLKFSAADALLETIDLPTHVEHQYFPARVIGAQAGSVFITLGDGRIGMLNAAGQFEWLEDFGTPSAYATAFGDGLLAVYMQDGVAQIGLIGSDSKIKLNLQPVTAYPVTDGAGPDAHAFFLVGQKLRVANTSGDWLLLDTPLQGLLAPDMLCAAAGRLLLRDRRHPRCVYCCDTSGAMLWSALLPEGFDYPYQGLLFEDGTALVTASDSLYEQHLAQLFSAEGSPQRRFDGLHIFSMAALNQSQFAATFFIGNDVYFGLFTNTGELLWDVPRPAKSHPGNYQPWEDRPAYSNTSDSFCGADQRIYFEYESTLYALDVQGNIAWREAGHEYADTQVPNYTGPPTGSGGGIGPAGGKTKPAD